MFNLQVWRSNGKAQRAQDLKERVLKNRAGVLDAMAENIKGARQCPYLLVQKCIGFLCEHFLEYKNINSETKQEMVYHRCVHVQMSYLLIELLMDINLLRKEIKEKV